MRHVRYWVGPARRELKYLARERGLIQYLSNMMSAAADEGRRTADDGRSRWVRRSSSSFVAAQMPLIRKVLALDSLGAWVEDDPYLVAYAERSLGQAYLSAADFDVAHGHFQSALALFRQLDIGGEIAASEQLLAEAQTHRTSDPL